MSHHIAMIVGMKENLHDVGAQSYLKKLILTAALPQECFQKFYSCSPISLETSQIWLVNQSESNYETNWKRFLAILTKVAGYPNEKIYAMGAPGDQKYGSVRFYRRRGNDLTEIPELALVGKDQFKKGLFQISNQVSHFHMSWLPFHASQGYLSDPE